MANEFNGRGLALLSLGVVMAYSAVRGKSFLGTVQSVIRGRDPAAGSVSVPVIPIDSGGAVTPGTVNRPVVGGSAATNQGIARMIAAPYGWSAGSEWQALDSLWSRESSWSNVARNTSSGAYGISQALPPDKLPKAGQPPELGGSSSAVSQIAWGLQYIQGRYGSPSAAWAHELANGWY